MGSIHTVQVGGQNYLIEPVLFTTTTNTGSISNALTANINNFELITGITISLKMSVNNDAAATLSINNGPAKMIYYDNTVIESNRLKKNLIYNLVYDGSVWHVIGEEMSVTETILPHKLTFGAGGMYVYDGSADVTVPVYTGTIF